MWGVAKKLLVNYFFNWIKQIKTILRLIYSGRQRKEYTVKSFHNWWERTEMHKLQRLTAAVKKMF